MNDWNNLFVRQPKITPKNASQANNEPPTIQTLSKEIKSERTKCYMNKFSDNHPIFGAKLEAFSKSRFPSRLDVINRLRFRLGKNLHSF